ncbi:type I-E CRISPR-associated protein Cas6/Cse3/CasE [Actinocorallia sp. A-T 12471]|uniref:type I-E CRISPR-associated protein Cas6/Cse3/CasE n=1 Tax=Actinocorallia sp. A-T 12471 TaxID=3089813 RepID=UPI0029CE04F5|nr:type I-E CRISPR-associated protein Cas6/Cse3/CasE [Actinocorallia sp. A-T 12471]MDX6740994.1 type I-E CRISPR-associated protein Cas6/Cse3/CasE [Actinocorallia sp. A-T 12471]
MYLTRFRVNTARREAKRLFGSPHRVHGAVNMAFPELPSQDGHRPRVLWRLDRDHPAHTHLFIVSPSRPDLNHLVDQAGWPDADGQGWSTFGYADFLAALAEGDTWAFRLTANPIHHIRREGDPVGTPTKRTAHVTPAHQMRWLLQRQEACGFEIVRKPTDKGVTEEGDAYELVVRDHNRLQFGKSLSPDGKDDVRFVRATFEGRLRITDLPSFHRTLTHGLGKQKAYGCGLMTLAPVR